MIHPYIVVAVIGLSFLFSLISFRLNFPLHLKVFALFLGLTFIVEFRATWLMEHHRSNVPLYNIFMLVESCFYAWFFRRIIQSTPVRKIINCFLLAFPLFWALVVFWAFGIHKWNSYVAVAESFFIICFSVSYYYQLFTQADLVRLDSNPEFWIATGLIIFYACNLPYMGMLNFLVKNYLLLARQLLAVLAILNIVMYSIFIYAFICRITTKKS